MSAITKRVKKAVSFAVAASMILSGLAGFIPNTFDVAASKKMKLSVTKKIELEQGSSKIIQVKGKKIVSKKFKSSNPEIAEVEKHGAVFGRNPGECEVSVKVKQKEGKSKRKNTRKYTCKVVVKERESWPLKATAPNTAAPLVSGFPQNSAAAASPESGAENTRKPAPWNVILKTPSPSVKPKEESRYPKEDIENDDDFVVITSGTSLNLLKGVLKKSGKENVVISPLSVITIMSCIENGADGETLAEMKKALHLGMDTGEYGLALSKNFINSSSDVPRKYEGAAKMKMANSLWAEGDGSLKLDETFVKTAKDVYGAECFLETPLQQAKDKINSWTSEHTDGMIPEIISDKSSLDDAKLVAVNALAFEGKWIDQYWDSDVREEEFTNVSGEKEKVKMLYGHEYSYIRGKNCTGFTKDYSGSEYSFMALLPDEGMDAVTLANSFDADDMTKLYTSRRSKKVLTKMPEFKYDFSTSLVEPLKDMGINLAFDRLNADFGRIGKIENAPNLYISDVIHKAHIELDRKGTKAAAATAVIIAEGAANPEEPPKVYLDRPFVWAIVHNNTGIPIFTGVVNSVK